MNTKSVHNEMINNELHNHIVRTNAFRVWMLFELLFTEELYVLNFPLIVIVRQGNVFGL